MNRKGWNPSIGIGGAAALCAGAAVAIHLAGLAGEPDASPLSARPSAVAPPQNANLPYDGRFIFARIRYGSGGGRFRRGGASWAHDYPQADRHLPRIVSEISSLALRHDGSNVFDLDDPELLRFPIAYLSEPGFWSATDSEIHGLRQYLLKGGFLIVDDFEAEQWHNFAAQMRRALPEYEPIEIDGTHSIFDSFFHVPNPYVAHPLVRVTPEFYGYFEDNDPKKRMLAMVNFNSDLAEYWEWSPTGQFSVDLTNEAYKLGVNYIIFGLTR
jgi:hypothetical protein